MAADYECREGGCAVCWLVDPSGPTRLEWLDRVRREFEEARDGMPGNFERKTAWQS